MAEVSLFWSVRPSDIIPSQDPIPVTDEALMHKLAHVYSVIEAQELELAATHFRSLGILNDTQVTGLAEAVFQFKPYLGAGHRHEIRYIIQWWLEANDSPKPSKRNLREIKYAIRGFRPVGLYYSDETQFEVPESGSAIPMDGNRDPSIHGKADGDLLDIGSDRGTPAAAAKMVEGLDLLFRRLGPPPENSTLQASATSSDGGGYGG
ncbi:hypothetical protein [Streptomyces herbicida]|uniref:hypothetical protein n=1 Tax=Streptomyces herbicida TaxID=3065675 RepID=UPI002930075C|nr:hypothetical protein [Streptomyces sp. NEAU-HV9]